MDTLGNPDVFIQGGAVGLALALIILLALILRFTYKMIANHMAHSDDIMLQVIKVLDKNTNAVMDNTRVMERVERILDTKWSYPHNAFDRAFYFWYIVTVTVNLN